MIVAYKHLHVTSKVWVYYSHTMRSFRLPFKTFCFLCSNRVFVNFFETISIDKPKYIYLFISSRSFGKFIDIYFSKYLNTTKSIFIKIMGLYQKINRPNRSVTRLGDYFDSIRVHEFSAVIL